LINRFDKPVQFQANVTRHIDKLYTPDFKSMAETIQKRDLMADQTEAAKDQFYIDPREIDKQKANEYTQELDSQYENIYEIYENEGLAAGDKATRDFIRHMKQEKNDPNSYYNKFAELKKAEAEFYSNVDDKLGDVAGADNNRYYAYKEYMKNYGSKDISNFYDKNLKKSTGAISNTERFIRPYVDVKKELTSILDKLDKNQVVELLGNDASTWFEKHTLKHISEDRIEKLTSKLMQSDEKIQGQIDVDAYAKADLVGSALKEDEKARYDHQINKIGNLKTSLNSKASSGDIQELQQELMSLGYNPGPIDGIMGQNTQMALDKALNDLNQTESDLLSSKQDIDNLSNQELAKKEISRGYIDIMKEAYFVEQRDMQLIYNKAKADRKKNSIQRAKLRIMQEQLDISKGSMYSTYSQSAKNTSGAELEANLTQSIDVSSNSMKAIAGRNNQLKKVIDQSGITNEGIAHLSVYSDNRDNFIEQSKALGIDPNTADDLFVAMTANTVDANDYLQSAQSLASAMDSKRALMRTKYSRTAEVVYNNPELSKLHKEIKEKLDLSDDEALAVMAGDLRVANPNNPKSKTFNPLNPAGSIWNRIKPNKKLSKKYTKKAQKLAEEQGINLDSYQNISSHWLGENLSGDGSTGSYMKAEAARLWQSGKDQGEYLVIDADGKTKTKTVASYTLKSGDKEEFLPYVSGAYSGVEHVITKADGTTLRKIRSNTKEELMNIAKRAASDYATLYEQEGISQDIKDKRAIHIATLSGDYQKFKYGLELGIVNDDNKELHVVDGSNVYIPTDGNNPLIQLVPSQNPNDPIYGYAPFVKADSPYGYETPDQSQVVMMIYDPESGKFKARAPVSRAKAEIDYSNMIARRLSNKEYKWVNKKDLRINKNQ